MTLNTREMAILQLQNCPECGNAYLAIRTDVYKDGRQFIYCDCCGCMADRRVWNRIAPKDGVKVCHAEEIPLTAAQRKLLSVTRDVIIPGVAVVGMKGWEEQHKKIGCTHPPGCTRCNWCGFRAAGVSEGQHQTKPPL